MFLVDTTIDINWILPPAVDLPIPGISDYDVSVLSPSGAVTQHKGRYLDGNALEAESFLAPTESESGFATYKLTPDAKGTWFVTLTMGLPNANACIYEHTLVVHYADTVINQQVTIKD